jgi:hypothetical protein
MVRVAGRFVVTGTENKVSEPTDTSPGDTTAASGSMIAAAMARWRESPGAELCAPLLDQAERLVTENPEASAAIRKSSDAVKFSLVTGDDREVRQMLDSLTDLLFEMA